MKTLLTIFNRLMEAKEYEKANQIAEKMVHETMISYNSISSQYRAARKEGMRESEVEMWRKSISYLKNIEKETIFLDVGAGFGKDLEYANNELGVKTFGIDNSKEFIKILKERAARGDFASDLIFEGDMRKMDFFKDEMFDLVRSNASLLHLPVICKGYMADMAVSEFYRILKSGGILYLLLKKGSGLQVIDTNEQLGGRLYQLYDEQSIKDLLERNGFEIVFINVEKRSRLDYYIDWINVIARKV